MILVNQPVKLKLEQISEDLDVILSSGMYSNFGPFEQSLTEKLRYLYERPVLLVNNGTTALMAAIASLGLRNKKLLIQDYSFVATAQAAAQMNCSFEFVDVNDDTTLCIDDLKAKMSESVDGIILVPAYGLTPNIPEILEIAERYGCKVIVDAAHAFGVADLMYNGVDAYCFSMHPTKLFGTFEGGFVVFNDENNLIRAKRYINFGLDAESGLSTELGINGKLNEFSALIALKTLEHVPEYISNRRRMAEGILDEVPHLPLVQGIMRKASNFSYFPIVLSSIERRDMVYNLFLDNGIVARKYFYPTQSDQPVFQSITRRSNIVSKRLSTTVLTLPLHNRLEEAQIDKIIKCAKKAFS